MYLKHAQLAEEYELQHVEMNTMGKTYLELFKELGIPIIESPYFIESKDEITTDKIIFLANGEKL